MGCRARHVLGFHAAQGHGRADDGFFIAQGDVGTGEGDIGEDVPWVGRIGSDLGLPVPRERSLDPAGGDDGNHRSLGLCVLVEINRVGDDMCSLPYWDATILVGLKDLGPILLDDIRQLYSQVGLSVRHDTYITNRATPGEGDAVDAAAVAGSSASSMHTCTIDWADSDLLITKAIRQESNKVLW